MRRWCAAASGALYDVGHDVGHDVGYDVAWLTLMKPAGSDGIGSAVHTMHTQPGGSCGSSQSARCPPKLKHTTFASRGMPCLRDHRTPTIKLSSRTFRETLLQRSTFFYRAYSGGSVRVGQFRCRSATVSGRTGVRQRKSRLLIGCRSATVSGRTGVQRAHLLAGALSEADHERHVLDPPESRHRRVARVPQEEVRLPVVRRDLVDQQACAAIQCIGL